MRAARGHMKVHPTYFTRAYLAEALGTFALVLAGAGAVMTSAVTGAPDHTGVALTFGLAVMACIYIFGGVSGAHINPAVTLALAVSGHFPWTRCGAVCGGPVRGSNHGGGCIAGDPRAGGVGGSHTPDCGNLAVVWA